MWGNQWKARSSKLVVDEIEEYIRKYNVNNIVFSDLTAVVNKKDIIELCNEIIKRSLKITIQLPTLRTEALDEDILRLMYLAGCRDLDFAIESASSNVLASVKKGNDPKRIAKLIKYGLTLDFNFSVNIILGLPQEGFRDFFKTYIMMLRFAVMGLQEVNAFPFVPYPGSPLFLEYLNAGKIVLNDDYYLSLFGYADLSAAVSWSSRYSARMLAFLRIFLMASFYFVKLVTHPKRLLSLFINCFSGKTSTKLEGVIARVIRNLKK